MAAGTVNLAHLDEAGFQRLYKERIEPCFVAAEPARLAAYTTYGNRVLATAPIVIGATVAANLFSNDVIVTFGVFVFFAVFACAFAYSKLAGVGERVKLATLTAIADAIGVTYSPTLMSDPPALARLREMKLIARYKRSKFQDLFSGAYENASFDLYEAHLESDSPDDKGNASWSTEFRGQIIRLSFPRKFLGRTIVRRDAGLFNVFGGGGDLQRVGLGDSTFEKAFEVYATDQIEARFLVHPALMERLIALEESFRGKQLRCAFDGGELLIAIEGGNLFEPGDLSKPLPDPARARRIVDEIGKVMGVMDIVLTAQAKRP